MAVGMAGMSRVIVLHLAADVPHALVPVTHILPDTKFDAIATVMELVPCPVKRVVLAGTVQL